MGIQVSPGLCVSAEICMTGAPGSGCACGWLIDGERQLPQVSRGDSEETAMCRAAPRLSFIHLRNWRTKRLQPETPFSVTAHCVSW